MQLLLVEDIFDILTSMYEYDKSLGISDLTIQTLGI